MDKKIFLLADTLPFETLLIYKNRKLFDFISKKDKWEKRLKNPEDQSKQFSDWTEPYKFTILKNDISTRTLSLIHPLAQLSFLAFIDKYDQEMIDYNKTHAIFSLRYPNKVNSITKEKLEDDYDVNIRLDENTENVNNDFEDKVDSYFSKGKFSKIHDFYNSYSMSRLETKYSVLLKIDYQNCFNSIYTHSLDWAYLGDRELSKQNIDKKNDRFSIVLDRVMQNANYGETNGIIVGPEFSRCVAEIVLSRIDNIVFQKLSDMKYIFKHDYEIVRFIDDIFVFTNDQQISEEIKLIFSEVIQEYKLSINESKVKMEFRPFLRDNLWAIKLNEILLKYFDFKFEKFKFTRSDSSKLIDDIKVIIIDNETKKHSITSYVFSVLENNLDNIKKNIFTEENVVDFKLLGNLMDLMQLVLVYSLTTQNIIKYSKIVLSFNNEAVNDESVSILIYKKGFELFKYNTSKTRELLNLLIVMKFIPNDLPEELLINMFKQQENDYFTLSALSFYMNIGKRKYLYRKLRKNINNSMLTLAIDLLEKYPIGANQKDSKDNIKKILFSKYFYIIHDIYSSGILDKRTISKFDEIKTGLKNFDGSLPLNKLFLDYIKKFDKSFMIWDLDVKGILEILDSKLHRQDTMSSS